MKAEPDRREGQGLYLYLGIRLDGLRETTYTVNMKSRCFGQD